MLISSILLALAFGIYVIALKELVLASIAKNSEIAVVAADRGLECALYWDMGYPQNGRRYTVFATSTDYRGAGIGSEPGSVSCFMDAGVVDVSPGGGAPDWVVSGLNANGATTDFQFEPSTATCVKVTVVKLDAGASITSTITASGYNLPCNAISVANPNPRIVERNIRVLVEFK